MSPVPEPVPPSTLADEPMPQHPPIVVSSSSDEEEDDEEHNSYPPGYLPITQQIDIQWSSDTEEDADGPDAGPDDNNVSGGTAAVTAAEHHHQQQEEEDAIDYNTVAGLMQALNSHGPTVVARDDWGLHTAYREDSTGGGGGAASASASASQDASSSVPAAKKSIIEVKITNRSGSSPLNLRSAPLRREEEEAVRVAMQAITLPASATPPWAAALGDQDLAAILKKKLQGTGGA